MVKIIGLKKSENKDGKEFFSLKLQGGVEAIQSNQTGKLYLTVRTTYISTTFDEATCLSLIGSEMPGTVKRVSADPYEYTIKGTGEVITLSHSFEYMPETEEALQVPQQNYIDPILSEI